MLHAKRVIPIRSALLHRWILSYICILLIPLIFCSFYYLHSYRMLKERTATTQHTILSATGDQINSVIYDTINLKNHLALDRNVIALSSERSLTDKTGIINRHYLQENLETLQISNSIIKNIDIYFPQSGYIVSSSSVYQLSLMPYMDANDKRLETMDRTQISTQLRQNDISVFSPEDSDSFIISFILQKNSLQNASAILSIYLDKSELSDRLENHLLSDSMASFLIINQDQILMSSGAAAPLNPALVPPIYRYLHRISDLSMPATVPGISSSAVIDGCSLVIPDIYLVSITDKSVYRSDMTNLIRIMIITTVLCLFTGITVILMLSGKNYRPVARIVRYISENDPADAHEPNEYSLIMKILTDSHNEIEYQHTLLRNNYLQKVFSGEIALSDIPDSVSTRFQLYLPDAFISVILISSADVSRQTATDHDSDQLYHFIIENILKELLSRSFAHLYFCVHQSHTAVLINTPSFNNNTPVLIDQALSELCSTLSRYHFQIHAGISQSHETFSISKAYLEAETALEYCRLFDSGASCHYSSIPQNPLINTISLNDSAYVINLVISGYLPQISAYFDKIDAEIKTSSLSWTDLQSCYYFFYQVNAQLKLHCQTCYNFTPAALDFIDDSYFSKPLPVALQQTETAFSHASVEIQEAEKELKNTGYGSKVCTYIGNNYFDKNMNLNTIAEYFDVSPSYLSKKFRDQYHKSIIDYLYEVRISRSKEIMKESSLKVAEIAEIVGFSDSNSFIRIFKKLTGSTPGKYASDLHSS